MKNVSKYIVSAAIGVAAALVIMFSHDITGQTSAKEVFRILSDSFFVPGVCLAGVGLIVWVSAGGVFDMLAYGVITLIDTFRRDVTKRKYKDFYEYRQSKKGEKHNYWFLFAVGMAFVAISIIFVLIYSSVS